MIGMVHAWTADGMAMAADVLPITCHLNSIPVVAREREV